MVFNSYIFLLLFLPLAVIGWHFIRRKSRTIAMIFVIGVSLVFCGFYNYNYVFVLAASVAVNFLLGRAILSINQDRKTIKKIIFIIAIVINIAILAYFKYSAFFIENINALFKHEFIIENIIIPLGISFYTFSQISYHVDLYRGDLKNHGIVEYVFYITYFPKLSMGPIIRFGDFNKSVEDNISEPIDWDKIAYGLYIFSIGLAKKVLIADVFALAVNYGYGNIVGLNSLETILIVVFYTIQIYFDFSGYSDMAIGISKMMNIDLPVNFNMPYKAVDLEDFWDRWHITLSSFFTRYLYIPLGGNRKGRFRTYLNVLIVFLVSGLWHGANWTFVLWGGLHGIFIVLTKILRKPINRIPKSISWTITFLFICFSWILFRADSLGDVSLILGKIFSFELAGISENILDCFEIAEIFKVESLFRITSLGFYKYITMTLFIVVACVLMFAPKGVETRESATKFKVSVIKVALSSVLLVWSIVSFSGITTYIYLGF